MASKKPKTIRESSPPKTLRARAEELLRKTREDIAGMPDDDVQALVHELQVHQMELEIQNEELRRAQLELAESRDRFSDLYEFAPVGYLSLEADGKILEANLTAAKILGVTRRDLAGSNITRFVARDDQDGFYRHRKTVLSSKSTQTCELTMHHADGTPLLARLESIAFREGQSTQLHCRTALIEITAQKRAEQELKTINETLEQRIANRTEALRESERRFRTIFEQAAVGVALIETSTGRFEGINQKYCDMVGYSAEQMLDTKFQEITHPDDLQEDLENMQRLIEGKIRDFSMEKRYFQKDGSIVWVNLTVSPTWAPGEQPRFHIAIVEDITERKRAEDELRASEERLRAILDAAVDAIVTIDRQDVIVGVNPAVKRLFGYDPGELLGKNVSLLMPASPPGGEHDENLENRPPVGKAKIIGIGREFIARRKDGSSFHADLSISEVDHLGLFIRIIRDITKRKSAEQALRRQHEFSEKIIATEKTVVLVLDLEGRVVRFNPYFEALSGWRLEEAEGRDWFSTFIPARDRKRLAASFRRALEGIHTTGDSNPVLTKEGHVRLIEWQNAPLMDDEGNLSGMLRTGIDVTERQALEQEVINAAEEERRRTAQDLHDGVGSLLTGIDFRMKALANACAARKLAEADEVNVISKLIRDAITQARAIARGLHPVGADPEDLMSALAGLVSQARSASNARCQFRCRPPVLIDDPLVANHLFRIAQEALNNAIKHSDAAHITISLAQKKGQTILKVLDDGAGFDPQHPGSSGLGLHVMRYRARAINASLSTQRRKKNGMEVICSVPVAP